MGLLKRTDPPEKRPETSSAGGPPEPKAAETKSAPFIPNRTKRLQFESFAVRMIATAGVIGIGTALAGILGWQDVRGWVIGLVVSTLTVVLAAVLWSSRTL